MKFNPITKRLTFGFDEVLFINTERKMLPFRNAAQCKVRSINSWQQFLAVMNVACGIVKVKDPAKAAYYDCLKVIVIDSFTRCSYWFQKHLREQNVSGHKYWGDYADVFQTLLMQWKSNGRFIVWIGLDEVVTDNDGIDRVTVKVEGQRLRTTIESYFSIVIHTHYNALKTGAEAYQFCTNTDGRNTAKTPEGMFTEKYVQNDMALLLGAIYDYYGMDSNPEFEASPVMIYGKSGTGKSTSAKYLFEE